jgi:hypothetical protein
MVYNSNRLMSSMYSNSSNRAAPSSSCCLEYRALKHPSHTCRFLIESPEGKSNDLSKHFGHVGRPQIWQVPREDANVGKSYFQYEVRMKVERKCVCLPMDFPIACPHAEQTWRTIFSDDRIHGGSVPLQ